MAGNTASFLDEKSSLVDNAPLAIGLIVLLTVVLLFLLTGSVLLPLKTLLMNTMTLAASLGILVIVFEKKFLVGLLDYPGPYSVEVTSLVFLFAVTFALATDYAVLVMARIKELRDGGMSNEDAVAHGVAQHRPDHQRRGDHDRRRVRRVRGQPGLLHEADRGRHGARRDHRRDHRPGAAGAVADAPARRGELVGARSAAQVARAVRDQGLTRRLKAFGSASTGFWFVRRISSVDS